MNALYRATGISKQAVYQYAHRQQTFDDRVRDLMIEAQELRRAHPGCGVEKMYYTLAPDFIGRDRFIETFMALGYRLKTKRNYQVTTRSSKLYFPNLIEGLRLDGPSQVWQSDITYIRVKERFYYAVFIIDVYSRKIVGYSLSDHMRATANVKALKMALKHHPPPKYHHSDRGSQYLYKEYTKLLKECHTQISMGKIAQENAYAERINGTIKNEYLDYWKPESYAQLQAQVKKAVGNYNQRRIHNNLKRKTPQEISDNAWRASSPLLQMDIFKYENV